MKKTNLAPGNFVYMYFFVNNFDNYSHLQYYRKVATYKIIIVQAYCTLLILLMVNKSGLNPHYGHYCEHVTFTNYLLRNGMEAGARAASMSDLTRAHQSPQRAG
jgi:hypothetical protein